MWIETQNGDLINSKFIKRLYIHRQFLMIEFADGGTVTIAEYSDESKMKKALEEFKTKLRRCGEKIFKFKESDENETD